MNYLAAELSIDPVNEGGHLNGAQHLPTWGEYRCHTCDDVFTVEYEWEHDGDTFVRVDEAAECSRCEGVDDAPKRALLAEYEDLQQRVRRAV